MVATAVEAVVAAVDSEVAPSAAEVVAVDSVAAAEAVAAVDLKAASEVVVEVVVLVAAVEVAEVVAVAATTVIKRATLLVNALRIGKQAKVLVLLPLDCWLESHSVQFIFDIFQL